MRLWTLHPLYLDSKGLVAVWREALLAQAVLRGATRGYRQHPQLQRFREQTDPLAAIAAYLHGIHQDAEGRGYRFDATRVGERVACGQIAAHLGQLRFEWQHLQHKLAVRSPETLALWQALPEPEPHPLFHIVPGGVQAWERGV